jgi:hypothetical protein
MGFAPTFVANAEEATGFEELTAAVHPLIARTKGRKRSMMERTFYQVVPGRLARAFGLSLAVLACGTTLLFLTRSNPALSILGKAGFVAGLLTLAYSIVYVIGLCQPMLLLTPKSLVYRKVRIPWNVITDVKELNTSRGPCVGVVIQEGKVRVAPTKEGAIGPTAGPFLLRDLERYGAIAVPAARGATVEELRAAILDYRARALATS